MDSSLGKDVSKESFVDTHQKTAALLDRFEPEFATYLSGELIDLFLLPAPGKLYRWTVPATSQKRFAIFAALVRLACRWVGAWTGKLAIQTNLESAKWLARQFARKLPVDCEQLIISQDYLPYLWLDGVLTGKRFSVLLTRPPLCVMHERLDAVARSFPAQKSLQVFRATQEVVEAESEALLHAERVITPHQDMGHLFPNVRKLEWHRREVMPPPGVRNPLWLLFPASLALREGAHAALIASERVGLPLLVCGDNPEGISVSPEKVRFTTENEIPWNEVAAVIHPALFKSWPRLHLHALALGVPVIASAECGLADGDGVSHVGFNDDDGLVQEIERVVMREVASEVGREIERLPADAGERHYRHEMQSTDKQRDLA